MNAVLHALTVLEPNTRPQIDGFEDFAIDFEGLKLRCHYRIDEYGQKSTARYPLREDDGTPTEVTILRAELVKGSDAVVHEIPLSLIDTSEYETEIGQRIDAEEA